MSHRDAQVGELRADLQRRSWAFSRLRPFEVMAARSRVALVPGDPRLRAVLQKLKADQRAWEDAKARAAVAETQRERDREAMAALFLAGLAVIVATSEPQLPSPQETHQKFIQQWAEDLAMARPCRTSTGRPC